eukprot:jgi/Botrbrau1/18783/Bobra.0386s0099.1
MEPEFSCALGSSQAVGAPEQAVDSMPVSQCRFDLSDANERGPGTPPPSDKVIRAVQSPETVGAVSCFTDRTAITMTSGTNDELPLDALPQQQEGDQSVWEQPILGENAASNFTDGAEPNELNGAHHASPSRSARVSPQMAIAGAKEEEEEEAGGAAPGMLGKGAGRWASYASLVTAPSSQDNGNTESDDDDLAPFEDAVDYVTRESDPPSTWPQAPALSQQAPASDTSSGAGPSESKLDASTHGPGDSSKASQSSTVSQQAAGWDTSPRTSPGGAESDAHTHGPGGSSETPQASTLSQQAAGSDTCPGTGPGEAELDARAHWPGGSSVTADAAVLCLPASTGSQRGRSEAEGTGPREPGDRPEAVTLGQTSQSQSLADSHGPLNEGLEKQTSGTAWGPREPVQVTGLGGQLEGVEAVQRSKDGVAGPGTSGVGSAGASGADFDVSANGGGEFSGEQASVPFLVACPAGEQASGHDKGKVGPLHEDPLLADEAHASPDAPGTGMQALGGVEEAPLVGGPASDPCEAPSVVSSGQADSMEALLKVQPPHGSHGPASADLLSYGNIAEASAEAEAPRGSHGAPVGPSVHDDAVEVSVEAEAPHGSHGAAPAGPSVHDGAVEVSVEAEAPHGSHGAVPAEPSVHGDVVEASVEAVAPHGSHGAAAESSAYSTVLEDETPLGSHGASGGVEQDGRTRPSAEVPPETAFVPPGASEEGRERVQGEAARGKGIEGESALGERMGDESADGESSGGERKLWGMDTGEGGMRDGPEEGGQGFGTPGGVQLGRVKPDSETLGVSETEAVSLRPEPASLLQDSPGVETTEEHGLGGSDDGEDDDFGGFEEADQGGSSQVSTDCPVPEASTEAVQNTAAAPQAEALVPPAQPAVPLGGRGADLLTMDTASLATAVAALLKPLREVAGKSAQGSLKQIERLRSVWARGKSGGVLEGEAVKQVEALLWRGTEREHLMLMRLGLLEASEAAALQQQQRQALRRQRSQRSQGPPGTSAGQGLSRVNSKPLPGAMGPVDAGSRSGPLPMGRRDSRTLSGPHSSSGLVSGPSVDLAGGRQGSRGLSGPLTSTELSDITPRASLKSAFSFPRSGSIGPLGYPPQQSMDRKMSLVRLASIASSGGSGRRGSLGSQYGRGFPPSRTAVHGIAPLYQRQV